MRSADMPTTCRYFRWHFSPRKVPAPEIPANSTIPLTNSRYADGMPERRRVKSRQELGRRRPPCPRREILEAHLSPCRKPKLPALGVYPEASLKRVRRAAHARPHVSGMPEQQKNPLSIRPAAFPRTRTLSPALPHSSPQKTAPGTAPKTVLRADLLLRKAWAPDKAGAAAP